MDRIFGLLRLDHRSADPAAAERLGAAMAHGVWTDLRLVCNGPLALGECRRAPQVPAPAAHAGATLVDPVPRDTFVVAAARLDNAEELRARLQDGQPDEGRLTTQQALLNAAYRRWGARCPAELLGDFAFALWERGPQRLFLARDQLGVQPLYYCHLPGRIFAFASELSAVLSLGEVSDTCDERRIGEHLLLDFGATSRTFYRDVRRLPAASTLCVDRHRLELARYWSLADEAPQRISLCAADAAQGLLARLRDAVRARLPVPGGHLAALLSGGLDSSTVTLLAREALDARGCASPLPTYSAVFDDVPACDERHHIARVTEHRPGLPSHFVRGDQIAPLTTFYRGRVAPLEPVAAPNAFMSDALYHAAAGDQVQVLLEGIDGDVTMSHGHARLAELAVRGRWWTLVREARCLGARNGLPWHRALWLHALRPWLPPSLLSGARRIAGRESSSTVIRRDFARRVGLEQRGDTLRSERQRAARREASQHREGVESGLLTWVLERKHDLGSACGIDSVFPLCDLRVLRWCFALPPEHKLAGGWSRISLRRALAEVAPAPIAWRIDKSDLGPNFLRAFLRDEESTVRDALWGADCGLAQYVDLDVARTAFLQYMGDPRWCHARPVWTATTLALWLRSRQHT